MPVARDRRRWRVRTWLLWRLKVVHGFLPDDSVGADGTLQHVHRVDVDDVLDVVGFRDLKFAGSLPDGLSQHHRAG